MTPLAPWRQILARALHRNRALAYARYFQLATVSLEGRPANRTVVFRGWLSESNQLTMITDQRSFKITQIQQNPWAEICWYFPKTREQFRLSGRLNIVDAQHPNLGWQNAYYDTWQRLSDAARAQFYGPAPNQIREEPGPSKLPCAQDHMPETFQLLVFEPQEVDHLDLCASPQDRHRYWLDKQEQWQTEWLTP